MDRDIHAVAWSDIIAFGMIWRWFLWYEYTLWLISFCIYYFLPRGNIFSGCSFCWWRDGASSDLDFDYCFTKIHKCPRKNLNRSSFSRKYRVSEFRKVAAKNGNWITCLKTYLINRFPKFVLFAWLTMIYHHKIETSRRNQFHGEITYITKLYKKNSKWHFLFLFLDTRSESWENL